MGGLTRGKTLQWRGAAQWNQTSVISNQTSVINNHTSVINNQPSLHHVGVFLGGLIAGTGLGRGAGHLVVTSDDGLGKMAMELEKETY